MDIFVVGVGTGGTITGVGEYLKEQNPDIRIVAVEPAASPVLSKGTPGAHKIQGIGAGFVPDVLNTKIYDEVIAIENEDAFAEGKSFALAEGIVCGIRVNYATSSLRAVVTQSTWERQITLPEETIRVLKRCTLRISFSAMIINS